MPLLIGVGVGFVAAQFVGGEISKVLKWGVIGGGVYVGAKALKVI